MRCSMAIPGKGGNRGPGFASIAPHIYWLSDPQSQGSLHSALLLSGLNPAAVACGQAAGPVRMSQTTSAPEASCKEKANPLQNPPSSEVCSLRALQLRSQRDRREPGP